MNQIPSTNSMFQWAEFGVSTLTLPQQIPCSSGQSLEFPHSLFLSKFHVPVGRVWSFHTRSPSANSIFQWAEFGVSTLAFPQQIPYSSGQSLEFPHSLSTECKKANQQPWQVHQTQTKCSQFEKANQQPRQVNQTQSVLNLKCPANCHDKSIKHKVFSIWNGQPTTLTGQSNADKVFSI